MTETPISRNDQELNIYVSYCVKSIVIFCFYIFLKIRFLDLLFLLMDKDKLLSKPLKP